MKLVFTIIGCLTYLYVNGQEFAPIGSEWYYTNLDSIASIDQGYLKIKSVDDTIIQGKNCKQLTKTKYSPVGSVTQQSDEFLYTSGDTVFRLSDNDTFYILYNFAAQVGDSWVTRSYNSFFDEDIEAVLQVDSISTTIINGETLKVIFIESDNFNMSFGGGEWANVTERLGGKLYMFPQHFGFFYPAEFRAGLRCYNDSIIGQYNSGIVSDCEEKTYTPNPEKEFAPVGSEWHYTYINRFFDPTVGYFKVKCIADTVIQGITCKHLTKNNYGQESDDFLYTDGDIVYRLSDNDTFYILYNFAAQIGDTWTARTYDLYAEKDVETTIQVEDISTTTINGQTLRQLYVTSINGNMTFGSPGSSWGLGEVAHITEKLGGGGYLLPQDYGLWDYHIRIGLRCYEDPFFGHYNSNPLIDCDAISTAINEIIINPDEIKVYPNPTFDIINIDNNNLETNIQVFDSTGRLILSKSSNDKVITFDLNPFPSGLYYLKIYNEKSSAIRKVVKR